MKILVTGRVGFIGCHFVRHTLENLSLGTGHRSPVTNHVVINASAFTTVYDAESQETDAFAVKAPGAQNLEIAASETAAKPVQPSTDSWARASISPMRNC